MTRTHSNSNPWAGSPGDLAGRTKGLTPLGKDIGKEMNRLGMMVDISHVSGKTFWDALEVSSTPLIASHSISNIPRNKTGEMIVALAKNGGVAQVNFGCGFDSQKSANRSSFGNPGLGEKRAAAMKGFKGTVDERRAKPREVAREMGLTTVPATLADAVAPIHHDDVRKMPNLTRALFKNGNSAKEIRNIYGGNLLRETRTIQRKGHVKKQPIPVGSTEPTVRERPWACGPPKKMKARVTGVVESTTWIAPSTERCR